MATSTLLTILGSALALLVGQHRALRPGALTVHVLCSTVIAGRLASIVQHRMGWWAPRVDAVSGYFDRAYLNYLGGIALISVGWVTALAALIYLGVRLTRPIHEPGFSRVLEVRDTSVWGTDPVGWFGVDADNMIHAVVIGGTTCPPADLKWDGQWLAPVIVRCRRTLDMVTERVRVGQHVKLR